MTTTDDNAVFLDTNILVFADVIRAPLHAEALHAVQSRMADRTNLWISRQVLREYLSVITRAQFFAEPLSPAVASERARAFEELFRVADETPDVTERLLRLLRDVGARGRQVHDANIVATMLCNGVRTLVTDNVVDFRRYEPLITVVALRARS
jgi:predicted nucleic acid-binding protein